MKPRAGRLELVSGQSLSRSTMPPLRHAFVSMIPHFPRRVDSQPEGEPARTCGYCCWSWAVGTGDLLCLNPESPHAYDTVPSDLICGEQTPDSAGW